MSEKNTGKIEIIGMVKNIEQKYASKTNKYFFLIDIQPVNGYMTRVQAWEDAYDFILSDQIKCGDIIWVHGYYHTYEMTPKGASEPQKFVTFKSDDIRRPGSRFECDVTVNNWNIDMPGGVDGMFYFTATPTVQCFNDGKWLQAADIICGISNQHPQIQECSLVEGAKYHIIGSVDNRDKTQFKTMIDIIYPIVEEQTQQDEDKYYTAEDMDLLQSLGFDVKSTKTETIKS